jgi:hypothetical protein
VKERERGRGREKKKDRDREVKQIGVSKASSTPYLKTT